MAAKDIYAVLTQACLEWSGFACEGLGLGFFPLLIPAQEQP